MPWKESSVTDEGTRFGIRHQEGESMASVCREFGILRKSGIDCLSDRSRKPYRYANKLPPQVEAAIIAAKRDKLHWP